ncbi:hypothetical protein AGMMS49936_08530 [Endomicrobiia bacterium]|nr:hypothetical protein AGMMS49936_08530 [Endomicrobiia bacterium]
MDGKKNNAGVVKIPKHPQKNFDTPKLQGNLTYINQKQGDIISRLFSMVTRKRANNHMTYCKATDIAKITDDDGILTLFIEPYNGFPLGGMPTEAMMMFDSLLFEMTKRGFYKDHLLRIPIDEYMNLRHLANKDNTYKQINKYFECLEKIKIIYKPRNKILIKEIPSIEHAKISLYGGTYGIQNGILFFRVNPDFAKLFSRFSVMKYYLPILQINNSANPHAYYFIKKLYYHTRINRGKGNENHMLTKTILLASPKLSRYEDIVETGQISQRIVKPTIATFKMLKRSGFLKQFSFCHRESGTPIHGGSCNELNGCGESKSEESNSTRYHNSKRGYTSQDFFNSMLYYELSDLESTTKKDSNPKQKTNIFKII